MENQNKLISEPILTRDRASELPGYLQEIKYRRAIREIREALRQPQF